jgi:MarR family 2-MHQ and catechol resistance regulon transcriptional repressor
MKKKNSREAVHTWLIWIKATQAIMRYAAEEFQQAGLGESDFRVLEVLLHKGPLPVNTIGPTVNLTTGSISVAVDRLHRRGLVNRSDCAEDRRVRIVELTRKGRELILPVFQKHCETMTQVFSELTDGELRDLETTLRLVGKHAEKLGAGNKANAGKEEDAK